MSDEKSAPPDPPVVPRFVCGPSCWEAVKCPVCGSDLPPRGRSVALAATPSECCMEHRNLADLNPRHLWDEHDSTRVYTDPEGWKAHVDACETCS